MKQRTTLLLPSLETIDTDNILFSEERVKVPASVFTARQDRLTVAKEELPQDLNELFSKLYMFRVQWSAESMDRIQAFQNFAQTGFSVNMVPTTAQYEPIFDQFGEYVNKTFGVHLDHKSVISTATSASFNSLAQIKSSTFQQFVNSIIAKLERISFIQHFDIVWEEAQLKITWISEPFDSSIVKSDHKKEIALFEARDLYGDLELSGIRTVIGPDYTPPEKTLLIVKPRHSQLDEQVSMELSQPVGLHPELRISNISDNRPHESCELFIYNTIPNVLFFDKYQYNDKKINLLQSWGEDDLEGPVWKVEKFGSAQLFHVLNYTEGIEIKFHSRYIKPSSLNSFNLPTPELFWGCEADTFMEDWENIATNPFETYNLGYESFFEPSTVFYHYKKNTQSIPFSIPTADAKDFSTVQYITLIAVILGSLYLFRKLFQSYATLSKTTPTTTEKKTK